MDWMLITKIRNLTLHFIWHAETNLSVKWNTKKNLHSQINTNITIAIVQLLLHFGANFRLQNKKGISASDENPQLRHLFDGEKKKKMSKQTQQMSKK